MNANGEPYKCFNIVEEGVSFVDFPENDRMKLWDSLYAMKNIEN